MREIKFRAWDKQQEKMFQVSEITWTKSGAVELVSFIGESYCREAGEVDLLQYTGLKDKNGKEIYQGNILSWDDGIINDAYRHSLWQVVWKDACLVPEYIGGGKYSEAACYRQDWGGNMDIIGGIYENPELLRSK